MMDEYIMRRGVASVANDDSVGDNVYITRECHLLESLNEGSGGSNPCHTFGFLLIKRF